MTGKDTGLTTNSNAAAEAITTAETIAHNSEIPNVLNPFLSFINEAVPEDSVMNVTGIAMNTPILMRYDETDERIPAVAGKELKSRDVARPINMAAMYVIHVFI